MMRQDDAGRGAVVGFVGPVPPIQGGISQHSQNLVDVLRERGHEVRVYSWAAQYPSLLYRGVQPRPPATSDVEWRLRWYSPLSWLEVGRRLRTCDFVVFPWVHPFQAVMLWVILSSCGKPSVAVVHNMLPHERFRGDHLLVRWVLRRVDGVLVHTTEVAKEVGRHLPSMPHVRISHPPNLAGLIPTQLPAGSLKVLFLGYVRPYKGVDLLLDALLDSQLRDAEPKLTIAGEMWEPTHEDLSAMIDARGLAGRVHLLPGYVPDDRVGDLLASHHLIVAPYRSASQSGVVPLAHAAGRPVVVTNVGGLAEQVRNGVDGVVVPSADVRALAKGLRTALERLPVLAQGAAEVGASWDDVARGIEHLAGWQRRERLEGPDE